MKDFEKYHLLRIVKDNLNIDQLKRYGLDYAQIAELFSGAVLDDLLVWKGKKIEISNKGLDQFNQLEKEYKMKLKEEWIDSDDDAKVPKLDRNVIFVPNQDELTFLL